MTACNAGNISAFKPTGENPFDRMKTDMALDIGVAVLKW
jgi:hypothetical protein